METTSSVSRITRPDRRTLPLEMYWTGPEGPRPLGTRWIRPHDEEAVVLNELDPVLAEYPHPRGQPLNFSLQMHRLCSDIVSRCPTLHHIDMQRILIGVTQARTRRIHGLMAKIIPLRLRGGVLTRRRRGYEFQVQRCWLDGVELLYLIAFCMPRFHEQSFDEKFVTVFHELYHIAPTFDGDLRRHDGHFALHTHSQKGYDQQMAGLAREYLAGKPDPSLHAFLRLSFQQLHAWHGGVHGLAIPVPRLIPIGV
jgi:hypothetical protein